jgi:hypothetical protein
VSQTRKGVGVSLELKKVRAQLKRDSETAFKEDKFHDGFSKKLIQPHNTLHISMGCDMATFQTAAYDPMFWLHHSYVDRQFAFWQKVQEIRGLHNGHDQSDTTIMKPFNDPEYNPHQSTRKNSMAKDTFNYTHNLCYIYDNLTFNGMTPQQFVDNEKVTKTSQSSSLQISSLFAGIVLNKTIAASKQEFSVCGSNDCVAAGVAATFGMASQLTSSNLRLVEYDITEVVENNRDSLGRPPYYVNITQSIPNNQTRLGPVMIDRSPSATSGGNITITLPLGISVEDYGDLLNPYQLESCMRNQNFTTQC